jgi:hypothetical protein
MGPRGRLATYGAIGAACVLGAALAASCAFAPFELVDAPVATASGAGGAGGTGGTGGGGGSGACDRAIWPDKAPGDPEQTKHDFVVAVRVFNLGEGFGPEGPAIGFDLDDRCTCLGEGDGCVVPSDARPNHCDGPGGRDNNTARLFQQAQLFFPDASSQALSRAADAGLTSVLVRVSDYNGLPNDDKVRTALYLTPGIDDAVPPDCPFAAPEWDGKDVWPIATSCLEPPPAGLGGATGAGGGGGAAAAGGGGAGGMDCTPLASVPGYDLDKPLYYDDNAYVSGGVLVANLPTSEVIIESANSQIQIKLTAGFATARISPTSDGWALVDGILTGRAKQGDVFKAVSTISKGGKPVCTDHFAYPTLKQAVCSHLDVASTLGGPTTPCDAISFAVAFEAEPAKLGIVVEPKPPDSVCDADKDPAKDSCP